MLIQPKFLEIMGELSCDIGGEMSFWRQVLEREKVVHCRWIDSYKDRNMPETEKIWTKTGESLGFFNWDASTGNVWISSGIKQENWLANRLDI